MVAVVWCTGSSGISRHNSRPAIPEPTATNRAIR
jgi:hypothetical protein